MLSGDQNVDDCADEFDTGDEGEGAAAAKIRTGSAREGTPADERRNSR
jgi:hypothetical protein